MIANNEKYSIILPGRVVAYYPDDQTADVIVSAERITHDSEETYTSTKRSPIKKMPVHTPSGGGWSITMPIKPGDTCLLFFSQIGYDHWFYKDKDTAGTLAGLPKPHLSRQFNEDDGFALVGMNTIPRKISNYHATHSQWRGPDPSKQVISLNDDETITIESSTKLTIIAPSVVVNCDTAEVTATATVDVVCPLSTFTGNVVVNGTLNVTGITTTNGLIISAGAAADMGNGSMTHGGNYASTGTISVNGVQLETHTHGGVQTGGGSTAVPN